MNGSASGTAARRLAADLLMRIDRADSYANIVVPAALDSSDLSRRDRALVTELVYGATRMRRACDWLVDRFVAGPTEPRVRAALRLGAYQLAFTEVPDHAAVATAVAVTPKRARGLVNAVLRKVARGDTDWPDEPTRLSYPDWLYERLVDDLGATDATEALEAMNRPPAVTRRDDGYTQDLASQWVADEVTADVGGPLLDCCAAPGGKATALTSRGFFVVAADSSATRVNLVEQNRARLGMSDMAIAVADATAPPFRAHSFAVVLVDAPCSGLGVLRRRPDARWRITSDAVARLAELQRRILHAVSALVAPGGSLVYSVCTLTRAETAAVAESLSEPGFVPEGLRHEDRWRPLGSGGVLLPQDHDTDGMALFSWRRGR